MTTRSQRRLKHAKAWRRRKMKANEYPLGTQWQSWMAHYKYDVSWMVNHISVRNRFETCMDIVCSGGKCTLQMPGPRPWNEYNGKRREVYLGSLNEAQVEARLREIARSVGISKVG